LFSEDVKRVNKKYKALIEALPREQLSSSLKAVAWWAVGTLLLFTSGWTIGWVAKGFRKNAA
jgi:hypothetical protein